MTWMVKVFFVLLQSCAPDAPVVGELPFDTSMKIDKSKMTMTEMSEWLTSIEEKYEKVFRIHNERKAQWNILKEKYDGNLQHCGNNPAQYIKISNERKQQVLRNNGHSICC